MTEEVEEPVRDKPRRLPLPVAMPYRLDEDLWLLVVPGEAIWILLDSEDR